MPLTGFNELKRQTIRDKICANDDSGLGESVRYIFKNGDECTFDAQVSFSSVTDEDKNTNLRMWDITVLIMKEYLEYKEPKLGDQIEVIDSRWEDGERTDEKGRIYGTKPEIVEEGSSWWRVAFVSEKLITKQVQSNQSR